MEKGRFGISVTVIAVIAFVFGLLRQPQSVLLVVGFALLAEKNEWLNKQVMQSLLLTLTYYAAILVLDWILGGISRSFAFLEFYNASGAISKLHSFIGGFLYIALIILSVMAILNVLKGKDAGLPYFSKFVASGRITNLSDRPQQTKSTNVSPLAETKVCPSCSASLENDTRFCVECGGQV